jgi:hypothetical protein
LARSLRLAQNGHLLAAAHVPASAVERDGLEKQKIALEKTNQALTAKINQLGDTVDKLTEMGQTKSSFPELVRMDALQREDRRRDPSRATSAEHSSEVRRYALRGFLVYSPLPPRYMSEPVDQGAKAGLCGPLQTRASDGNSSFELGPGQVPRTF